MTIVTTHYRYKRPPRKRKPVALNVPAIVRVGKKTEFLQKSGETPPVLSTLEKAEFGAISPETRAIITIPPRKRRRSVPAAPVNDGHKSGIVTIRKRTMLSHLLDDLTPEAVQRRGDAADVLWRVREDWA